MTTVAILLAWALVALQSTILLVLVLGSRRLRRLPAMAPEVHRWPSLSVVLAARDEEEEIEGALRSLLASDYPALEVVAVDDRSSDATPEILARLAGEDPRLTVVRVEVLPPGWLGKNHALQCGASRARGDLLLFTDADVAFSREALRKAAGTLLSEGLDHLAVAPLVRSPSPAVNLVVTSFAQGLGLLARPWRARDPRSRAHIGLGAFNLVRRRAYEAVGGHAPIRLRPDDDLKLGKLLKREGFRQDCRMGQEDLRLAWYPNLGAFVRGLEKNVLAGLDYSLPAFLAAALSSACALAGPWALLFWGPRPAVLPALAAILTSALGYAGALRRMRLPPVLAVADPIAQALMTWTFIRSGLLAYLRGGIAWRGTFYRLSELRSNRVDWVPQRRDRGREGP